MKKKITLIGYGVIGKRIANAFALEDNIELPVANDMISHRFFHSTVLPGVYAFRECQKKYGSGRYLGRNIPN